MVFDLRSPSKFEIAPKAVIFDTDNTLYEYAPPHTKAMVAVENKAMKALGIEGKQFKKAFEQARDMVKARLGNTASSHSRLLYFQRALEILGLRTQLLLTLDLEQTYWRTFLSHCELFSGVRAFLSALRREGIHTAIITDLTSQVQFRKIIYFGLDDLFDFVVTSEEAGIDKPTPRSFELTLEKLGIDSKDAWMVGDNSVSDILGAQNVGMTALQKFHRGVKIDEKITPDLIFGDFDSLHDFMRRKSWVACSAPPELDRF